MKDKRRTVTDLLDEIKLQLRAMERITTSRTEMFEACTNIRCITAAISEWAKMWCEFIEGEEKE